MRPKAKYAVIYRHRNEYPVSVMCTFFEVSRSGYYDFVKRIGKPEQDVALAKEIEECQNRTDSEIQKRQTPEDGIQSAMKLLLDAVCIEQNRNRTQKNHDKAERTQSGGIWN